jgi:hypothetical protein
MMMMALKGEDRFVRFMKFAKLNELSKPGEL